MPTHMEVFAVVVTTLFDNENTMDLQLALPCCNLITWLHVNTLSL